MLFVQSQAVFAMELGMSPNVHIPTDHLQIYFTNHRYEDTPGMIVWLLLNTEFTDTSDTAEDIPFFGGISGVGKFGVHTHFLQ